MLAHSIPGSRLGGNRVVGGIQGNTILTLKPAKSLAGFNVRMV